MKSACLTICIFMLCLAGSASGQSRVHDFSSAVEANPLLVSGNASLMASLQGKGFSEVSASFAMENGALIALEGSPEIWTAGINTKSYRRVSDKLVLYGLLSYSHFRGKGMGAQILMDPRSSLINFLEENNLSTGVKKRETYSLRGSASYSVSDRVNAGISLGYTAADQTKTRDPRFLNMLMEMSVSPGMSFRSSGNFTSGFNLVWRQVKEQLSAGVFGTVERQYNILVDQGGFLGSREVFDGDMGYVSTQNTRLLSDSYHGLSIQGAKEGKSLLFAELTALWRSGYYGNRSATSVVFCEVRGPELKLRTVAQFPSGRTLHMIELDASASLFSKYTNSYAFKAEAGMNTVVEYLGQNKTLSRTDIESSLSYSLKVNPDKFRPDWEFKASAGAFIRKQATIIYPDYRNSGLFSGTITLSAERNVNRAKECISLGGAVFGLAGTGNAKTDGSYADGTTKLKSFDNWLYRQFEYDTAGRLGGRLSVRWTMLRFAGLAPYIELSDSFTSLLGSPEYLDGKFRNSALITIGCNF